MSSDAVVAIQRELDKARTRIRELETQETPMLAETRQENYRLQEQNEDLMAAAIRWEKEAIALKAEREKGDNKQIKALEGKVDALLRGNKVLTEKYEQLKKDHRKRQEALWAMERERNYFKAQLEREHTEQAEDVSEKEYTQTVRVGRVRRSQRRR